MTEKQKIRTLSISTGVLSGLLIVSIGYIFSIEIDKDKIDKAVLQHCIQDAQIDADLVDSLRRARPVDPDRGAFIRVDSAKKQFKRFHTPARPDGVPYSFSFGINKLNEYMENIRKENLRYDGTSPDRITGVRIYLTKRFTELPSGKKRHTDVLLVPVKPSGDNYIRIGDATAGFREGFVDEDPLLLNTSSPCPDMCNEK